MSLMGLAGFAEGFGQAKQKKNDQARYDAYLARQETRMGAAPMPGAGGESVHYGTAGIPQTAEASAIRAGLIQRGMPEHIADAFILNFKDESGLNPSITEAAPNVHGTRGRGLYQLTGDRREAYEAKFGDRYDIDSQLDWLMYELNGPEARAGQAIFAAPDTGQAAAAIVSKFLRPAEKHRIARVARYTGSAYPPRVAPQPAPAQPAALPALGAAPRPPYRSNPQ